MDLKVIPGKLSGRVSVVPSKSQAHRYLICAAFADRKTMLHCPESNRDMEATVACLGALGAEILRTEWLSGNSGFPGSRKSPASLRRKRFYPSLSAACGWRPWGGCGVSDAWTACGTSFVSLMGRNGTNGLPTQLSGENYPPVPRKTAARNLHN